jgi:hypothetical protein
MPNAPPRPYLRRCARCAGVAPDAPAVAKYQSEVHYGQGTPGLREIEPSIAWNPATLGGIGIVRNPQDLYNDMHHYLKMSGALRARLQLYMALPSKSLFM